MLAQEPWCYTPEQIGKLTDWQIENLYAKPAAERAEELRKEFPDEKARLPAKSARAEPEPGTPEHRRMVISAFINGPMRMDPQKAVKLYEQQLAAYRAGQGSAS